MTRALRVVLLAALCAGYSYAQDGFSQDAPLADIQGESVKLEAGTPAPFSGRLLSENEQIKRGKKAAKDSAELAALKSPANITVDKGVLATAIIGSATIAAVVTGLVVGFVKANTAQNTPPEPDAPK